MPFATEAEQIRKFENDEVAQHYFEVLRTLISKKSIFAQQVGLKEVANYLGEIFTAAGAKVEVDDSYTAPFVIAKFFSPNPEAKTIIFYNHYDTVPADGDQPWTGDPFTLSVHYGTMYGRGVDDDKGHITARLTALRKYIRESGDLPVNITFIIEGAEESASTDLDKYLAKHKKHLRGADLLVWEQGTRNNQGQLEISGGSKGIVTFDMVVDADDAPQKVAQVVKEQLETTLEGLTINLTVEPKKQRVQDMQDGTFELGLTRWGPDYADPMTYLGMWVTGNSNNYGLWSDADYDAIIDECTTGDLCTDPEGRWAALYEAEQIVLEQAVIFPLYGQCNAEMISSAVKGVEHHPCALNRVYKNTTKSE